MEKIYRNLNIKIWYDKLYFCLYERTYKSQLEKSYIVLLQFLYRNSSLSLKNIIHHKYDSWGNISKYQMIILKVT